MKLADTHTILWLMSEDPRLSDNARAALASARAEGGIALSSMSLLEIARLERKGRVILQVSVLQYLKHLEQLCTILPINAEIAVLAAAFTKAFPRDPADRTIAATALHYKLPLITVDEPIRASNEVPCIW